MKEYKSSIPEYKLKKIDSDIKKAKLFNSDDAYAYALQFYKDDIDVYESSFIILLNSTKNTIGWVKLSHGGITGTIIDIRLVCKYAISTLATAVIVCHNHPSGGLEPSKADIDITNQLKDALQIFSVTLLDHIIITKNGHHSIITNNI